MIDELRTVSLARRNDRAARLAAGAARRGGVRERGCLGSARALPAGSSRCAGAHARPRCPAALLDTRRPRQSHGGSPVAFRTSEPVPGRPALDTLLSDAGIELAWDSDAGSYRPVDHDASGTGSTRFTRQSTTLGGTPLPDDPDILDAAGFERRLEGSVRHGGFLCLVAHSKALGQVREELTRRFGAQDVSLDRVLIHHLRLAAAQRNVVWERVLAADAASHESKDWSNLNRLVRTRSPQPRRSCSPKRMPQSALLFHTPKHNTLHEESLQ